MDAEVIGGQYLILDGVKSRNGAHSFVRKAVHMKTGNQFALKFVVGRFDEMTHLIFSREADALERARHPNVVPLIDSGIDETDTPYLVLPWVERSYKDILDEGIPGSPIEVLQQFILPIVSALSHAHLQSVLHRDVKPANILVTDDGVPLLADFSIGKQGTHQTRLGDKDDLTMKTWRTGLYAPPELEEEFPYSRDIFSIAVVFIESISRISIKEQYQLDSALDNADLPLPVKEVFRRCVSFTPSDRPPNGAALLADLQTSMATGFPAKAGARRIWLSVTQSALRSLGQAVTGSTDVNALIEQDLRQGGHVFFTWDKQSRSVNRDAIELAGDSISYLLKPNLQNGSFVVTSARFADFETLEWIRRKGISSTDVGEFSLKQPLSQAAALQSQELMLEQLRRHVDHANDVMGDAEAAALVSRWKNLLDARESLERGARANLKFSKSETAGKDIKLTVDQAPSQDVVGTAWVMKARQDADYGTRVEIIRQQEDSVVVRRRTRKNTPFPRTGILVPHLGASQVALKRQNDAIEALESKGSAHPDLLSILVDPGTVRAPVSIEEPAWHSTIDSAKKVAVKAALGLVDAMVVKGPPGTGKTRFITEAIFQALKKDPKTKILVVSQTHVAVDNALERLDAAQVGNIVRLGREDDERISKSVNHLLLEMKMAHWAQEIRNAAELHMTAISSDAGIPIQQLRLASLLEQLVSTRVQREVIETKVPLEPAGQTYELTADLTAARDAVVLQDQLDRIWEEEDHLWTQIAFIKDEDLLVDRDSNLEDLRIAVDMILEPAKRGTELLELLKLQADWLQRISSDSSLTATYLQTANVVAGTCLGFLGHPSARDLSFDLCILDEASKATATEALVPLVRSKKFILVGDSHQLPPMEEELLRRDDVLEEYELTRETVSETLFERLASLLPAHSQFLLTDQHRMTRAIGDLISTCFYEGKLNSPSNVSLQGYESIAKPVLWLDTSNYGARRFEEVDAMSKGSYFNRLEAQILSEHLESLDRAIDMGFVKLPNDSTSLSVLLIAPYRSQLDAIKREIARWSPKHLLISVESIDAVQGKESDLAFLTVTRNNKRGSMGFIGHDYWRRINVALSRARLGLTIIGDAQFCGRVPGPLADVLEYISTHPRDCEVRTVDANK